MPTRDQELFDRRPGLFTVFVNETDQRCIESLTPDEVRDVARKEIAAHPEITIYVYSQREQQFMFWYDADNLQELTSMIEEFTLEPETDSPAPQPAPADPPADTTPSPRKRAGDRFPVVRGRALRLGKTEGWPPSAPAQLVRQWFDSDRVATTAEILQALGPQLNELGMQHPSALVRRLKRDGFLVEVVDVPAC